MSCGKLSKGLICVTGVPEVVEGVETEKIFGPKFSKFNENDKPTNSSSKISKHNMKKPTPKHIVIKWLENCFRNLPLP